MKKFHLLAILAFGLDSTAATLTIPTAQHATIQQSGATANGDFARFATRFNAYSLSASYLVLDFAISPSDFGLSTLTSISNLGLTATHQSGQHTIGRFDVFYVENTTPRIDTGTQDLVYDGTYSYGFSVTTPPAALGGLALVSAGTYYSAAGDTTVNIDLSGIAGDLLGKINNGEKFRFVISEAVDTTVSSWHGLNSEPTLAPRVTISAIGIPEPGVSALTFFAGALIIGIRRRAQR